MALRFSFWTTLLLMMTQGAFGQLTNNQPLVVTWISPANGATFQPGATISLVARVDTNSALSFVEFFAASTNQMMNLGRGMSFGPWHYRLLEQTS